MSFKSARLSIAAAFALTALTPIVAVAAQTGTPAQQQQNAQQKAALQAKMKLADARINEARHSKKISAAKAAALHKMISRDRSSMNQLNAKQGFVSAAEFASYERTLGMVDKMLDKYGVARSYGNDMLVAPKKH